jgi:hypothetical protein
MVSDNPIGVGRGVRLGVGGLDLSLQVVVKTLEKTLAQVHVSNGVDALGELNTAGQLTVPVAPVVLDTLQVPLVDQNYDLLSGSIVYFLKQLLVLLIHKDLLKLGEENRSRLSEPVHLVLVHTLLGERSGAHKSDLLSV